MESRASFAPDTGLLRSQKGRVTCTIDVGAEATMRMAQLLATGDWREEVVFMSCGACDGHGQHAR